MSNTAMDLRDCLDPRESTWARGISLTPAEPRVRAFLIARYRELLETTRWLGNTSEEATILSRLVELGAQP
jgi:hypothetical protein